MNTLLTILNSKFIQSSLALRCLSTACEHQGVDVAVAEYTINQNVYDILRHIASFPAQFMRAGPAAMTNSPAACVQ